MKADFLGPGYQNGTGALTGWQTFWDASGFLNVNGVKPNTGELGQGASYHITSAPVANASLAFHGTLQQIPYAIHLLKNDVSGTGIAVYGSSNSSYSMYLDGTAVPTAPAPVTNGVLFESETLQEGQHSLVIQATPVGSQQFALDRAVVFQTLSAECARKITTF
jgi:hypothetical protein